MALLVFIVLFIRHYRKSDGVGPYPTDLKGMAEYFR